MGNFLDKTGLARFKEKMLTEVDSKLAEATGGGLPVGSMVLFPNVSSLPTGYMACDGSAISRTTYSVLFSLIGTTFGSGDGSTTFNLPKREASIGAIETWDDLKSNKSSLMVYIIKVK